MFICHLMKEQTVVMTNTNFCIDLLRREGIDDYDYDVIEKQHL